MSDRSSAARLFVAARPDRAALDHLAGAVAAAAELPDGPRWTEPTRWHLTLTFLGEVDESRVDRLGSALAAELAERPAVRLRLAGAGTFPPRGSARVLWIGVSGADEEPGAAGDELSRLDRTARAAARAARSAGVDVERRPFRPHLTVGRWRPADRAGPRVVDALAGYQGPPFRVTEVELVRSHLGPDPRHEPVAAWSLLG